MSDSRRPMRLALGILAGAAGIAVAGLAALYVVNYAGGPWNLMRVQVGVHAQESPPLPAAPGSVPFADGRWPREGGPVPPAARSILNAERIYRQNCVFCHGAEGRGDGPVAAKMEHPPEDLTSWRVQYRKDTDLFQGITHPGRVMPPFAQRLEDAEIWDVVYLIRESFQPGQSAPWLVAGAAMGESLYEELGCDHCHGPERVEEGAGIPPTLEYAGSKLKQEWVVDYLLGPHRIRWQSEGVRPAMWMPAFSLTRPEAEALAQYLAARVDGESFPDDVLDGPADIDAGREAFDSYQCRGCHILDGDGTKIGPDLSGAGLRLRPAYLYQFLLDPKGVIPGTSMKNVGLWDDEARDLVGYLQTLRKREKPGDGRVASRRSAGDPGSNGG